jgi:hypothetical protein
MPVSEFLEYSFTVVTDGRQLDPLLLKPFSCCLQLDQLRFAEGSPIRRTEKQQNGSIRSLQCFVRLLLTLLIAELECGNLASDFASDG